MILLLAGCGKGTMGMDQLEDVQGVKVTCEKAAKGSAASSAFTVAEGEILVVSPDLTKGKVRLQIAPESDPENNVIDEEFSGRILEYREVDPGSYVVEVSVVKKADGAFVVAANNKEDVAAMDEGFEEAMETNGGDPDVVEP